MNNYKQRGSPGIAGAPRLSVNVHISSEAENTQLVSGLWLKQRLCREMAKQMVINSRPGLGLSKRMHIKLLQGPASLNAFRRT